MKRWLSNWIVPLFLMGLGATGAYRVYRDTRLAVESEHWVAGKAMVDRAWLEKHHGRRGSINYEPRVKYRYSVNGSDYVGSRLEIPMRSYPPRMRARRSPGSIRGRRSASSTIPTIRRRAWSRRPGWTGS